MTTIAYRDGVIAADTQSTCGSWRNGSVLKIRERAGVLAGASGSLGHVKRFLDWFAAGMIGNPPKMPTEGDDVTDGFIFHERKALVLESNAWIWLEADFFSFGSGCRFALGAMKAGASAEQAVRIACELDIYSGGDIRVLRRSGA